MDNQSDFQPPFLRRSPRLVTMQVEVTVTTSSGEIYRGLSTGLNENGVGARIYPVNESRTYTDLLGQKVTVSLDLPVGKKEEIKGPIIRQGEAWVPGFQYFIAVKFEDISHEDITYLKKFIRWRESQYFRPHKPERRWYVYNTRSEETLGPITIDELKQSYFAQKAIQPEDYLWFAEQNQWIYLRTFWEQYETRRTEPPPAGSREAERFAQENEERRQEIAKSRSAIAEPSSRDKRKLAAAAALVCFLLAAGGGAVYFFYIKLPERYTTRYRAALQAEQEDKFQLAADKWHELQVDFPHNRLSGRVFIHHVFCTQAAAAARRVIQVKESMNMLFERLRQQEKDASIYNNIGCNFFYLEDYLEAEEHVSQALSFSAEDNPNRIRYLFNRGAIILARGQPDEALLFFEKVISLDPGHFKAYYNMGICYLWLQRLQDARDSFHYALQIAPERPSLQNRIKALNLIFTKG